jgi:hypothetical protein
MLRPNRSIGFAVLLAAGLTLAPGRSDAQAQTPQAAPQKSAAVTPTQAHKAKSHSKKPAPVAEVAQAPVVPPTLEQQPPVAPQVIYRDGQLTINAANATLSQVLRSVQTQTGASIEVPPGAGSERVVASLGPGKPKDVLSSLLNGSKFNYVILGDSNNSGAVQKVILLAKSTSTSDSPVNTAQNNFRPQPQGVEPPEDEYPQNEPEVDNSTPLTPGQLSMPGGENLQPDVINPAGRTPEQMLQELQRMQQQQQQMQQQLNPANQQPSGSNPPAPSPFPSQASPRPQ